MNTVEDFPEPCYACEEPAPLGNVCDACRDACCKEHSVIVEGIVYCDYCYEALESEPEKD